MNKKNSSYIGISLIILIFGIIFIPKIVDRIGSDDIVETDRLNVKRANGDNSEVGYIEQYGKNKRVPDFQFINQDGDTISNEDYLGKVYVVEFFFSTCPSICPIMNANLINVQKEFKGNDDFGIASFTIDPEHDTPEVLKEYKEGHGISNKNWNFLTGDREEIYKVANSGFGIFADKDQTVPGGFAHSGLFALIDQEGFIRSRNDQYGNPIIYYRGSIDPENSITEGEEKAEIEELIADIKTLLK
ncbi:protein SCO1/2 [Gillisia sp. Hel1_33_143]|uniref:SCO family protein n=1 Tax=Gillisia sp. Hel1_33_143 TaxID=1336796 RepID=UPI00087D1A56|nr:SCO family protein [Gillisia sp. Hel1_33_143]SDR71637.1 protein SCO1/2 [Gillisia sp. Hel1_33_143]